MRLQTWKPQKFKEKLIGNHKETKKNIKKKWIISFHATSTEHSALFKYMTLNLQNSSVLGKTQGL